MADLSSEVTKKGFRALNQVVTPLVRSGAGNPLPLPAPLANGGVLLLETVGRVSGLTRTVPLVGVRSGSTITVSTVRGDSDWLKNLEAEPAASVWLNGKRQKVMTSVKRGVLNVVTLELLPSAESDPGAEATEAE